MLRTATFAHAGRQFRYLEAGDAASDNVLLWLHAFPLSSEMWRPQLEAAPSGWRLIAPDLAGLGGTDDHPGPASIDDLARDVDMLLTTLGIERAVIGGLSMGAYAAFACHRLLPARIRALVLADTRSTADTEEGRLGRETMIGVVDGRGPAGVADEMLPKLVGSTTKATRPEVVAHVRALIEGNSANGIRRALMRLRDRPDATPQLAAIRVPTLVIAGEEDVVTPVGDARQLKAGIADATLVILPAAGHLSNLESPDSFNAALRPWLSGL
jgi:pimeloyl-ACP methyl ester carboxylesterase